MSKMGITNKIGTGFRVVFYLNIILLVLNYFQITLSGDLAYSISLIYLPLFGISYFVIKIIASFKNKKGIKYSATSLLYCLGSLIVGILFYTLFWINVD